MFHFREIYCELSDSAAKGPLIGLAIAILDEEEWVEGGRERKGNQGSKQTFEVGSSVGSDILDSPPEAKRRPHAERVRTYVRTYVNGSGRFRPESEGVTFALAS